jgi:SAM-dependent methyltransferase
LPDRRESLTALSFDEWETTTQSHLYRKQLEPLKIWIKGRVLDVASNYGRFSALATSPVSVDIERKFLRRGIQLGNIKHAIVASALSLPFRSRAFDTVLAMGIIDHIPEVMMPQFLDELTRVTNDAGVVIIQVTSPYSVSSAVNMKHYGDDLHAYSPFRLLRQLGKRGWKPVSTLSSGVVGMPRVMPYTVDAFLPWAVHLTVMFGRRNQRVQRTVL